MIWKDYSHLKNSHAFLSASRYYWLNYTEQKLVDTYDNHKKAAMGTKLHNIAADLIRHAIRTENTAASFNSFVNDAIGFKMEPEKLLFYSMHCYGTADAISYRDGMLRIHDLKTGVTTASMDQLLIYAALFCLDYTEEPSEIQLRIYQNSEILIYDPFYSQIQEIMAKIIDFNHVLERIEANDRSYDE